MGKILIINNADFSTCSISKVNIINSDAIYINVIANPTNGGTVSGIGKYIIGQETTITATSSDGFIFSHWSDGNTSAIRQIVVDNDVRTYTAIFIESQFNPIIWTDGFCLINSNETTHIDSSKSYGFSRTDYIEIPSNATKVLGSICIHTNGSVGSTAFGVIFFDSSKTFISGNNGVYDIDISALCGGGDGRYVDTLIPENAKYVIFNNISRDPEPEAGVGNYHLSNPSINFA